MVRTRTRPRPAARWRGRRGRSSRCPRRLWCAVDVHTVSAGWPSRWVRNDKLVSGSTSGGQHSTRGSPAGWLVPARSGMTLTNSGITHPSHGALPGPLVAHLLRCWDNVSCQVKVAVLALTLMDALSPRSGAHQGDDAGAHVHSPAGPVHNSDAFRICSKTGRTLAMLTENSGSQAGSQQRQARGDAVPHSARVTAGTRHSWPRLAPLGYRLSLHGM
jgi:hypothetical protein